jgi:hypothetical protein
MPKPHLKCDTGSVCNLELNWSASLSLDNGGTLASLPTDEDITHLQSNQITSSKLAVNC